MYESTVNIEKQNEHLLSYVKTQLAPCIHEVDGIATEVADNFRNYYSVACADTYRFQIGRCLNAAVTEALSLGYKNVYMRELLNIDGDNFYQNVLVNTICIFDNEYDKQMISRVVDTDRTVCLDGYFNFKLSHIKKKWLEISKLVGDNGFILTDNDLIAEFVEYLLDSMSTKEKTISVSFEPNGFIIYGQNDRIIEKIYSLAKSADIEEEAMLNIICLKPRNVKVYYTKKPSEEFCKMLDRLFFSEYIKVD